MSYRLKLLLLFAFIADRDKSSFRFSPLILFPKLRKLCESQGPCPITWITFPQWCRTIYWQITLRHWFPFELQNFWLVSICNWKKGHLILQLTPCVDFAYHVLFRYHDRLDFLCFVQVIAISNDVSSQRSPF